MTRPDERSAEPDEAQLARLHAELRRIAAQRMRRERPGHTLQPTALLHEAWLRLAGEGAPPIAERGRFLAAASEAMRRVLVDHARRARARKRGGARGRVTLGAAELAVELPLERALAVGEALAVLAAEDEQAATVARLRWLAGLSVAETAAALRLSERTVHREWDYAKARLAELL